MPSWVWGINVIDGPLPYAVWAPTVIAAIVLLARKPTRRWLRRLAIGVLTGALIGGGVVFLVDATQAFGDALPGPVVWWAAAAGALIGLAVVTLWDSAVWRKVVAVILVVLTLLSATLGVNAAFGIDRTLGDMVGVSSLDSIDGLTGPNSTPSATGPVYLNWTPPADMPAKGKVGLLTGPTGIPSSAGFAPRDASIYLPPAAQVREAPALPLVVMMMGMPGNPDPSFIAAALDDMAAKHKGIAPIVIVADQLGEPNQDPVCTDSKKYGGVATYFNKDIVDYAKSKLNVLQDPKYWTIAGYSNGGACAFTWATQHPEIWGNLIDISGDETPGVENPDGAISDVYAGDKKAYEANSPSAWIAKNSGMYTGHVAVFTVGQNDSGFLPGAERNSRLAQAAGFTTTYYVVPGAGHVGDALTGGLPKAFEVLYPPLGLAAN